LQKPESDESVKYEIRLWYNATATT